MNAAGISKNAGTMPLTNPFYPRYPRPFPAQSRANAQFQKFQSGGIQMNHMCKSSAAAIVLAFSLSSAVLNAQTAAAVTVSVGGAYEAQWKAATDMESKALGKLRKAQDQLARANRDIGDAINKQTDASNTSTTAAAEFRQLMASVPAFNTSSDAHAWAKKVEDGAKRWGKSDKRGTKGGKELAKATKKKAEAEASIVTAQADVDHARALKADATRLTAGH